MAGYYINQRFMMNTLDWFVKQPNAYIFPQLIGISYSYLFFLAILSVILISTIIDYKYYWL